MALHIASHQTENLICPECGLKLRRVASFKAHLVHHMQDDNLHCPQCDSEFVNENLLQVHLRLHHGEGKKPKSGLDDVVLSKGDPSLKSSQLSPKPSDLLGCLHCGKEFSSLKMLNQHKKRHSFLRKLVKQKQKKKRQVVSDAVKKYPCKFCNKTFKKPSQRERHERIHTGVKPFKVRNQFFCKSFRFLDH